MVITATLFSGLGAPETAMPGWDWRWHAEIEKFPSAVMAARYPGSVNLGDVTADDFCSHATAIAKPDVIVFGSPCQSFSVAGRRLGLDDPRGNLALVALRIVARLEPRWFCFENVPGLLSSAQGCDFGLFLRAVDEIGYSLCWSVLDAQHFGLAQRRERVFAVGHSGDWRGPAAVLLEPESMCGDHPTREGQRQEVAGAIGAGSARSGARMGRREAAAGHLVAPPLNAGMDRRRGSGAHADALAFNNTRQGWWNDAETAQSIRKGNDAGGGGARESTLVAFGGNNCGGHFDLATAVNAHGGPHGRLDFESETFIAFDCKAGGNTSFSIGELPGSLRGEGFGGGHAAVNHASAVRRLTPRECERLQGFPDDYTLIPYRGRMSEIARGNTHDRMAADGPRYRALGNSMAVPVVRWILQRREIGYALR